MFVDLVYSRIRISGIIIIRCVYEPEQGMQRCG